MRRNLPFAVVLAICLVAASCSRSALPASPSATSGALPPAAQPDFSGVWTGAWVVDECSHSLDDSWLGYCLGTIPGRPTTRTLRFQLEQVGDVVSGSVTGAAPGTPSVAATGRVDSSGELRITEHIVIDQSLMDGYTTITDTTWRLRKSAAGTLTGRVVLRSVGTGKRPGFGEVTGTILSAILQTF